ncbi:class I SAM-dependent methyltransferase [Flavihumibacter sp. RY-1]|uniref:Class I SAM-dependent methyltransferase n=1 Tax=Flavihumibacter fluminis TaxID=2909236 RepID=A0ABS9BNY2_9BACT|nr:class I SAM-dependent methyltransferase [Flavihumibacter fluminis]MCF1716865.1 class I SAM-dependent methyltransferase [Flavihumibacter fluminis]
MSNVSSAYNQWAEIYDSNKNRTRDLEAISLRTLLAGRRFSNCLEIGCGTGKNTEWLLTIAEQITAVDLSEGMLTKAREKINSPQVAFIQADITQDWQFTKAPYDLATFSLVLEHIENLDSIFAKLKAVLQPNGYVYVGELHPFKQYTGTKARFETAEGQQVVTCFNHHVSEFYAAAKAQGFELVELKEWFDEDNRELPRILSLLFKIS